MGGDGSGSAIVDAGRTGADAVLGGAQPRIDGAGRRDGRRYRPAAGEAGFRVRAHFDSVDKYKKGRQAAFFVL